MRRFTFILLSASLAVAAESPLATVTGEVLMPGAAVNPIGVHGFGSQGPINYSAGNLLLDAGFEPQEMRALRRIVSVGEREGRRFFRIDEGGTSDYAQLASGAYSGTSFRAYRIDVDATPGRISGLEGFRIPPRGSPGLPAGGWISAVPDDYEAYRKLDKAGKEQIEDGCIVVYEGPTDLRVDDIVVFARRELQLPAEAYHPRKKSESRISRWWQFSGGTPSIVRHEGTLPDGMDGGESYLHLAGEGQVLAHHMGFRAPDGKLNWYGQLEPGVRYVFSAWMRRSAGGGPVRMTWSDVPGPKATIGSYFGTPIGGEVAPGSAWQFCSIEFEAPSRPAVGKGTMQGPAIIFTGGSLDLDAVRLQPAYEQGDAAKPFVVNRTMLAALLAAQPEGRKGTLRNWSVLEESSLNDSLAWHAGDRTFPSLPKCLTIAEATGADAAARMVPWINTQLIHSEEEHQHLIEYLAAPWNPAADNAATKPYAALRVAQRGHARAWTEDFRELIIELGNESWHNRTSGYIGVGRYGAVHAFGPDYGIFARHLIEAMRASPYWAAAKGRIRLAINGNYTAGVDGDAVSGYGPLATAACGLHDYESHANYVGPKWELGEATADNITDDAYRSYLISGFLGRERLANYRAALAVNNRKLGAEIRVAGYEGGPSGYATDNADPEHPSEKIGRSRAAAVPVADIYASSWEFGWAWQTTLSFSQGIKWCQFSSMNDGFRPDPGWLAMTMLNRYMAEGDLLKVDVTGIPEVDIDKPAQMKNRGRKAPKKIAAETLTAPAIGAYARRNGDHLSVLLTNRSLDQAQTVRLVLPAPVATATLHTLSGAAKDTNRGAARIAIVSRPWDAAEATKGLTLESANLVVLEMQLNR